MKLGEYPPSTVSSVPYMKLLTKQFMGGEKDSSDPSTAHTIINSSKVCCHLTIWDLDRGILCMMGDNKLIHHPARIVESVRGPGNSRSMMEI